MEWVVLWGTELFAKRLPRYTDPTALGRSFDPDNILVSPMTSNSRFCSSLQMSDFELDAYSAYRNSLGNNLR